MRKAILGVAVVSALALTSGMVLARSGGSHGGGHGDRGFSRIDTDGDGAISKVEFEASRDKMFQKLDANSDGAFTKEEATASAEAWRKKAAEAGRTASPEREAKHKERAEKMFNDLDLDKDGKISKAEFNAAGEKLFARFDTNGDGKIVKGEGRPQKSGPTAPPAKQ
ncbi:MAG: EF-hand domain-containing protein [Reyranellaceae bacterium]